MYSSPPIAAAIGALHTVVTGLVSILDPFLGAAGAGLRVRAALSSSSAPCSSLWATPRLRAEQSRTRLGPKVREIQRKYNNNPERMRRELAALYSREQTTPLAGCLPAPRSSARLHGAL